MAIRHILVDYHPILRVRSKHAVAAYTEGDSNKRLESRIARNEADIGKIVKSYLPLAGGDLTGKLGINTNEPGTSAKGIIEITSNADGEYMFPLTLMFPNLAEGHSINFGMGKEAKNNDKASFSYYFVGSGSFDNRIIVSFYGQNGENAPLQVYPDRVKLGNALTFTNRSEIKDGSRTFTMPEKSGTLALKEDVDNKVMMDWEDDRSTGEVTVTFQNMDIK